MLANDKLNQANPLHSLLSATLHIQLLNSLAQLRHRSSSSQPGLSVTSPQSAAGGSIVQEESS